MTTSSETEVVPHAQIRRSWEEVDRCHQNAGRFVYRLGAALAAAKDITPHGDWLPSLEDRGIKERSAQQWMQVAASMSEAEFIEHGSFRNALAAAQSNAKRVSDSGDEPDEVEVLPPGTYERRDAFKWAQHQLTEVENHWRMLSAAERQKRIRAIIDRLTPYSEEAA